jgi:hypothetical protein
MLRTKAFGRVVLAAAAAAAVAASSAAADTVGPITFEPPAFATGNINGQQGWTMTGAYDVSVVSVSGFPAAAGYGFGQQALRLSDAVTSGSFGDQAFSPGLASPAGESGQSHFDATFKIGTALATQQTGLHMSVSPDDGNGSRMSYLRFEDQADGVHVFFDDVTDAGPLPTVATFNETDIGTLNRTGAHSVGFSMDFYPGPANDVVRIYLDGVLTITGRTWEDYYRYDPEQTGNGNVVPNVSKLLFRESGTATPGNSGNGFLVDGVALASAPTVASGTTGVSASASETLALTAPANFDFGAIAPGASATSPGKAVKVVSNNAGGYTLTVKSEAVSPYALLPLKMSATAPGPAPTTVTPPFAAPTSLVASAAQFGARTSGITPPSGEDWTVVFTAGPIPFVAAGTVLKALVTFTATTI